MKEGMLKNIFPAFSSETGLGGGGMCSSSSWGVLDRGVEEADGFTVGVVGPLEALMSS